MTYSVFVLIDKLLKKKIDGLSSAYRLNLLFSSHSGPVNFCARCRPYGRNLVVWRLLDQEKGLWCIFWTDTSLMIWRGAGKERWTYRMNPGWAARKWGMLEVERNLRKTAARRFGDMARRTWAWEVGGVLGTKHLSWESSMIFAHGWGSRKHE